MSVTKANTLGLSPGRRRAGISRPSSSEWRVCAHAWGDTVCSGVQRTRSPQRSHCRNLGPHLLIGAQRPGQSRHFMANSDRNLTRRKTEPAALWWLAR